MDEGREKPDSEATDQFEFRSARRKMRSNVPHRRLAEEAAVFAIELRSAFVADLEAALAASRPLFSIRLRADWSRSCF